MKRSKPTALGGDIFAGLFTRGILDAGYEVLGHLEHTMYGTPTARLNYPGLDIRNGVHAWRPQEFRKRVDFLYSNPPCAAWSAMQVTKPWQEHEDRLQIVRDLVVAGQIIEPRAWCWESVMGVWNRGQEFVLEQARSWLAYGYHVTVLLQNNMHLGVSQNRVRMFLIAHRHPLVWQPFTEPRTLGELLKTVPKDLKSPVRQPPHGRARQDVLAQGGREAGEPRRAFDVVAFVQCKSRGIHGLSLTRQAHCRVIVRCKPYRKETPCRPEPWRSRVDDRSAARKSGARASTWPRPIDWWRCSGGTTWSSRTSARACRGPRTGS